MYDRSVTDVGILDGTEVKAVSPLNAPDNDNNPVLPNEITETNLPEYK
jgi:hypothetical protein